MATEVKMAVIFKICVIFGVRLKDEKLIEEANLHENRNMQTLCWSLLNISAKCRQKLILIILSYTVSRFARFFWDTVYNKFAANCNKLQLTFILLLLQQTVPNILKRKTARVNILSTISLCYNLYYYYCSKLSLTFWNGRQQESIY